MAAPFVDTARITVKAGSGGNGAVAFHRGKDIKKFSWEVKKQVKSKQETQ